MRTAIQSSWGGSWHPDGLNPALFAQKPVWSDGRFAAFGDTSHVHHDGDFVVVGEWVPDSGFVRLLRDLNLPAETSPLRYAAHLYRDGAFPRDGMWSLAFYNLQTHSLTLARDLVGARTLYYTSPQTANAPVAFAGKLSLLRHAPGTSGRIFLPALRDYLICSYVPGKQTLWENVEEVRPGSAVNLPGFHEKTYWTPRETPETHDTGETLDECARRLRPVLDDAVCRALPASGPVGAYLSGGVDSSLVVALAANRIGGENLHTFAIHFGTETPNELVFSDMVAKHTGTRHTVLELPPSQIVGYLHETIRQLDDPIGDPLTVPNYLLGRAARQTVGEGGTILNGEGGDPVFGGPKNLPMMLHELYNDEGQTKGSEAERLNAYFRSYQKCFDDLPRLLNPDVQTVLQNAPPPEEWLAPYLGDHAPMRSYLNRLMHVNVATKGADHILTKVANLTGAHGLIGRSPLFDPHIVNAGFAVPPQFKLAGTREKAVLKAAITDILPTPILNRPKSGMLVPVQRWMLRDMKGYAQSLLLAQDSRTKPYINPAIVRDWFDRKSGSPLPREGVKLWLLLTLEIWLRENS